LNSTVASSLSRLLTLSAITRAQSPSIALYRRKPTFALIQRPGF
jgi:hypothetical protein